ncbi:MAG: adenylate/guanylate cyclase domain-containing protein [Anaerolineae bacterium]|nr:adenylate/guanylate cyclase domain-containing protein [Anaerolineae bacterium]
MLFAPTSPLAAIEPRLRPLLPADLYAVAWLDPSPATLTRVFEHLRTLQRILYDYIPRQVLENLPNPGEIRYEWQDSTLMFTDLAGFTPLMEANAAYGREGAQTLLSVLNAYFAAMIEILSKSGGNLLEFTGDAMLVQFPSDKRRTDMVQAVRAGLRMQRAMANFASIETPQGTFSLGMRVGVHTGRFLTADIGTPRRMEHVLLGKTVQNTKLAEGAGRVGRVNLTEVAYERAADQFSFEQGKPGHVLVVDDLSAEQLGEYDITPGRRRLASSALMDRSVEGLVVAIEKSVALVEPLASYLPMSVLNLLVESAARRHIPPDFPEPTVIFVNLIGLPESVELASPGEEPGIVSSFSHVFARINAAVEARGGILKKVTYHLSGSDMMICFGVPSAHTDDPIRAAGAALAIRDIITGLQPPTVGGSEVTVTCQIGLARGPVFAAEIGEPRGRREFNVLGDTVNTAARLMGRAASNQILMTEAVYERIVHRFACEVLVPIVLKGKAAPIPVFALNRALDS